MNEHNQWLARRRRLGIWLSENCNKRANALNGVSFAELMKKLKQEGV